MHNKHNNTNKVIDDTINSLEQHGDCQPLRSNDRDMSF